MGYADQLLGNPFLSHMNLDYFGEGMSGTNLKLGYFDPAQRTSAQRSMYAFCDKAQKGVLITAVVLTSAGVGAEAYLAYEGTGIVASNARTAWNGISNGARWLGRNGSEPFKSAIGRNGAASQIEAWGRIGNTAADAINQALNYDPKQGWNWGATFGNLYLKGEVAPAIPGFAWNMYQKPNEWGENTIGFGLDILGNYGETVLSG